MQPSVFILVLAWNNVNDIRECLVSLQKSDYPNYSLVLVDNGSTDGTVACVREQFPSVHIIENKRNLGFAEGNNVGIRYALDNNAAYIFLLNDDTVVATNNFVTELVNVGEADTQIGMLTPSIISYYDHAKQYWGARLDWTHGTGVEDTRRVNQVSDTDFAQGCALMVKASVARKIGLLNPAYWAYFEDADWSLRCKRAGYRVVVVPQVQVYHKGTSDQPTQKSEQAFYYFRRNQWLFMHRYTGVRRWLRFLRNYTRDGVIHYQALFQSGERAKAQALVDGWWAGIAGQYGEQRTHAAPWFLRLVSAHSDWLLALTGPRVWMAQRWHQVKRV